MKNIKVQIHELDEKARKILRRKSDLENKVLVEKSLPKLRESIGKCFKYMNSYGGSNTERWPLYVKIISIDEETMTFTTIEFQRTSLDIIEVRYSNKFNYRGENYFGKSSNYEEIKLSEFNRAKKSALKFIQEILV